MSLCSCMDTSSAAIISLRESSFFQRSSWVSRSFSRTFLCLAASARAWRARSTFFWALVLADVVVGGLHGLVEGFELIFEIFELGQGEGVKTLFFLLDGSAMAEDGGEFEREDGHVKSQMSKVKCAEEELKTERRRQTRMS